MLCVYLHTCPSPHHKPLRVYDGLSLPQRQGEDVLWRLRSLAERDGGDTRRDVGVHRLTYLKTITLKGMCFQEVQAGERDVLSTRRGQADVNLHRLTVKTLYSSPPSSSATSATPDDPATLTRGRWHSNGQGRHIRKKEFPFLIKTPSLKRSLLELSISPHQPEMETCGRDRPCQWEIRVRVIHRGAIRIAELAGLRHPRRDVIRQAVRGDVLVDERQRAGN